ncbi:uncharacterized protein LOC143447047 [Clavelina lepadiformis]|uniref:uncharacterized protein LOC143447047 n=1 Tax=Clavelina lepadiformis TaxID=159417 RepID=UPI004042B23D
MSDSGCQTQLAGIECDGRMISMARDPPGQNSVYIPPVSIIQRFDQRRNVTPKPHSSHNGPMQRSSPPSAGEILTQGLDFMEETGQPNTSTYQTASVAQATRVPPPSVVAATRAAERNSLAHVTNSTLGEIERSRLTTNSLFPCSNSVNPHMRSEESRQNSVYIPPDNITEEVSESEQSGNKTLFPCSNPVNPHMRSKESRLQTFLDHSSSWPAHRIRATPRQIANAGMYYLGVRDRVKCWYCNGGLQNWERDDDPWEEHAKWFPMCEFVLQQKGPDYVHGIVSRFPNLRRPIIRNPANPTAQLRNFQSGSRGNPNAGPKIIDPMEAATSLERKIDEEMSSSELIEQARQFGFDESVIRTSLKSKFLSVGKEFIYFLKNTKPLATDFQVLKSSLSPFLRWRKNLLPTDLKKEDQRLQRLKQLRQHQPAIYLQHPDFKRFVVYRRKECVKFVAMNKRVLCLFHADILLVLVALKMHRLVPFVDREVDLLFQPMKLDVMMKLIALRRKECARTVVRMWRDNGSFLEHNLIFVIAVIKNFRRNLFFAFVWIWTETYPTILTLLFLQLYSLRFDSSLGLQDI